MEETLEIAVFDADRARRCASWLLMGSSVLTVMACGSTAEASIVEPTNTAVSVGSATITIQSEGTPLDVVGGDGTRTWVLRSAGIVTNYFGKFPVPAVTVRIATTDSAKMGSGRTFGFPRPLIEVRVGQHISVQSLNEDWVLVHEMTHLALPIIDDHHDWFAEGVAVYVEGVARTQAGNMTKSDLWAEYVGSMNKGLPGPKDRGLDRTHTWARTYWGGALYCLITDVTIREKSNNRYGLQDALRAIAHKGAGMSAEWPLERILMIGDDATATSVMTDLYVKMRDEPYAPDLDGLWIDLGIHIDNGFVRSITRPDSLKSSERSAVRLQRHLQSLGA
jgi:hypothetical protein